MLEVADGANEGMQKFVLSINVLIHVKYFDLVIDIAAILPLIVNGQNVHRSLNISIGV